MMSPFGMVWAHSDATWQENSSPPVTAVRTDRNDRFFIGGRWGRVRPGTRRKIHHGYEENE